MRSVGTAPAGSRLGTTRRIQRPVFSSRSTLAAAVCSAAFLSSCRWGDAALDASQVQALHSAVPCAGALHASSAHVRYGACIGLSASCIGLPAGCSRPPAHVRSSYPPAHGSAVVQQHLQYVLRRNCSSAGVERLISNGSLRHPEPFSKIPQHLRSRRHDAYGEAHSRGQKHH